jgi:ubiquinone/menaquinone biosynthesis C-methylase UbiE
MPVDVRLKQEPLYQRTQYAKGGLGRLYWDYRDQCALSYLNDRDAAIVDLGCGEGITLEKISRIYPEKSCIGIDYLLENLFICRSRRLDVSGGDIYQLPIKNDSIDCILFFEVIEHLDDPEKALGEIWRVLKPRGKLIILFPNDFMYKIARITTFKIKEAMYDPGHIKQWTPGVARKMARRNGFKVIRQRSIPFIIWPISLNHLMVCEKEVNNRSESMAR